ncbi:tRNA A64-2'-O-ribosylphosphate transferase [Gnomoniopsis smithogilvyi]|uniref:tRNA A64-2'-O-ribosylphosphate transferase n=1 Tax=Gnomoniopsis smithogilvyi TaxID=1191159 RepID=A0A9W9CW53_9PEZI|nr:tRNA A64-2'-O-ribosylphosphate transferase [Gnomoniopsis smithogilvyi]
MSSLSNILFPSQQSTLDNGNNINRILGDLKRSNLSITNRLHSIQQDADFVEQVAAAFGGARPLVANERCGSWYIRPERKGGSAYFKSTDGHTGQWKFSTRRLNLHLLPLIERSHGIIIVDSTRRGKRMPDALSKTIPIWCCIINRALFPDQPEFHGLYVPPNAVSDSEKSQMLARIPEGLDGLLSLNLDLASLRAQISKPVRPTWVTQETNLSHYYDGEESRRIFEQYRPVICCTSSKRVIDGEVSGRTGYVQGAGDDTENWDHGLEPTIFWEHAEQLLSSAEPDLPDLIKYLVGSAKRPDLVEVPSGSIASLPPTIRHLTPHLAVCPLPLPASLPSDTAWCTISISSIITPAETWAKFPTQLDVGLGKHKAASRNLRVALANICTFATRYLHSSATQTPGTPMPKRILISCETGGRDLAVGVALALLCWCFEDDAGGVVRSMDERRSIEDTAEMLGFNKTMIKVRLGRIMTAMPEANPNRATLQSVNSFLMDWRK